MRSTRISISGQWLALVAPLFVLFQVQHGIAFTPLHRQAGIESLAKSLSKRSSFMSMVGKTEHPSKADIDVNVVDEDVNDNIPFQLNVSAEEMNAAAGTDIQVLEREEDSADQQRQEIGIWAARGLLLFIAFIWGTNFASVKYFQSLAALARFGVASLVSIPLLIGQKKEIILAGLECGLFISLGYITQALALSEIDSGTCAFICSLTVLVVPVLSAVLYQKPIKPLQLFAGAMALAGVGILEGLVDTASLFGIGPAIADTTLSTDTVATLSSAMSSSADVASFSIAADPLTTIANAVGIPKGTIIALGQPFGFGMAFMRIEHYVEKFKKVENRILTLSAAQCVAVGLVALFWVLYDFGGTLPNFGYMIEPHRLVAIGWTGIVTTVFAIYLEGIALQTATATDAALTFASEPVWASLFGMWLLSEQLDLNAYIGGGIILLACITGALSDVPDAENPLDEETP